MRCVVVESTGSSTGSGVQSCHTILFDSSMSAGRAGNAAAQCGSIERSPINQVGVSSTKDDFSSCTVWAVVASAHRVTVVVRPKAVVGCLWICMLGQARCKRCSRRTRPAASGCPCSSHRQNSFIISWTYTHADAVVEIWRRWGGCPVSISSVVVISMSWTEVRAAVRGHDSKANVEM